MNSLEKLIARHAEDAPERVALHIQSEKTTYRELYQRIQKCAAGHKGMRGRGIVLAAQPSIDFLVSYFSAHVAGAVAVLLPANATLEQLARMEKALQGVAFPDGSADVLFTTGTTGVPKGVVLGWRALAANAANIVSGQPYHPYLTFIISGQLNHLGSLSKVWATIMAGATAHIMPKFDFTAFFNAAESVRDMCAAAFLVPSCIRMLTQFGGQQMLGLAAKMAFIETGGDALDAATMADIHRLLPHTRLFNTYASTETGVVSTFEFTHIQQAGCVGHALPHAQFGLTPEGFIRCEGQTLMSGYLNVGETTTFEALNDTGFTTLDCGTTDEEGRLHFKCRVGDIINTGGFKVSPQEVEAVANALPGVKASLCTAAPHPILGKALKLLVVTDDGAEFNAKQLAKELKKQLETHQVPLFYERVEKLKTTANGKIDRKRNYN